MAWVCARARRGSACVPGSRPGRTRRTATERVASGTREHGYWLPKRARKGKGKRLLTEGGSASSYSSTEDGTDDGRGRRDADADDHREEDEAEENRGRRRRSGAGGLGRRVEERRLGRRVWSGGLGRRVWRSGGRGCGRRGRGEIGQPHGVARVTASLGSRRRRGLGCFREWRLIWGRGEGSGYIRQGALVPVGGSNRD